MAALFLHCGKLLLVGPDKWEWSFAFQDKGHGPAALPSKTEELLSIPKAGFLSSHRHFVGTIPNHSPIPVIVRADLSQSRGIAALSQLLGNWGAGLANQHKITCFFKALTQVHDCNWRFKCSSKSIFTGRHQLPSPLWVRPLSYLQVGLLQNASDLAVWVCHIATTFAGLVWKHSQRNYISFILSTGKLRYNNHSTQACDQTLCIKKASGVHALRMNAWMQSFESSAIAHAKWTCLGIQVGEGQSPPCLHSAFTIKGSASCPAINPGMIGRDVT